jgi:hypothetical protein
MTAASGVAASAMRMSGRAQSVDLRPESYASLPCPTEFPPESAIAVDERQTALIPPGYFRRDSDAAPCHDQTLHLRARAQPRHPQQQPEG